MSERRFNFTSPVKVRFAETDANGHMSHVSVILYMEQARCDYLAALGLFDREHIQRTDKTFVLAKQSVEYRSQAYFHDELDVTCGVTRVGTSSLDIDYEIYNRATGTLIAVGTSTLVHFDNKTQKSAPLPADLIERIGKVEGRSTPC
jgi:acyl-CoA thioester hydrolase